MASRGAARNRMFGRHGNRPPGTTTCAARSSLHALRRQCRRRKRGPGAQKPPRWSAERRASRVMGRKAPRKRLTCRVTARPTGVSQTPERLSALRSPSMGVGEAKEAKPGRSNAGAGTRRCALFDIVKWTTNRLGEEPRARHALIRPHPEEHACSSVSTNGTCVRASRTVRAAPSCFETPRRSALKICVRGPKARLLSMRAGEGGASWRNEATVRERDGRDCEEPTCACGRRWSIACALFFTMKVPTQTCGPFASAAHFGQTNPIPLILSSPRGAPRDACVAGTPLRGPMITGRCSWVPALATLGRDDGCLGLA